LIFLSFQIVILYDILIEEGLINAITNSFGFLFSVVVVISIIGGVSKSQFGITIAGISTILSIFIYLSSQEIDIFLLLLLSAGCFVYFLFQRTN